MCFCLGDLQFQKQKLCANDDDFELSFWIGTEPNFIVLPSGRDGIGYFKKKARILLQV